jgi:hypothetical protein
MGMRLPAERGDGARRARLKVVLSLGVVIAAGAAPGVARAADVTFLPTGAEQTFTVPAGVTTVHAVAVGGKGADGAQSGGAGGFGALASADLAVTPGQTLYIEVGGNGSGSTGGFNGGGDGGSAEFCAGGGGGGASDIRAVSRTAGTSLELRLITAAGGGGGGGCDPGPGTPKGTGGDAGTPGGASDGGGGQPGTSTGGGSGAGDGCGGPGSRGAGGAGSDDSPCVGFGGAGGGGGGGGLFGGGGGGASSAAGGGGGGSSGFGDGTTNTSIAVDTTGEPSITLVYKGLPAKKAKLTALSLTNSTFVAGKTSTPLTGVTAAKHHETGTSFSFALDRAATVKITIQRRPAGRRINGVCKPPTHKLRHKPRCTRTIKIATLSRTGHAGNNKVAFSGRINGKALRPGNYRAVFTATTAAGPSSPKTIAFTIVRH